MGMLIGGVAPGGVGLLVGGLAGGGAGALGAAFTGNRDLSIPAESVVTFRLQDEYNVQCVFDTIAVHTAGWVSATDERKLEEFRTKAYEHLAVDHGGALVYLAPSRVNLQLTRERWPEIQFHETREYLMQ